MTGNDKVLIDGNNLKSLVSFNFEVTPSFEISVRSTNDSNLYVEKSFTITVNDINEPPTNVTLSQNTVSENVVVGTEIGTFTTSDPDNNNTYTYIFDVTTPTESTNTFEIVGDKLKTKVLLNYEIKSSYAITVNSNDGVNNISRDFTISITDVY